MLWNISFNRRSITMLFSSLFGIGILFFSTDFQRKRPKAALSPRRFYLFQIPWFWCGIYEKFPLCQRLVQYRFHFYFYWDSSLKNWAFFICLWIGRPPVLSKFLQSVSDVLPMFRVNHSYAVQPCCLLVVKSTINILTKNIGMSARLWKFSLNL